MLNDLVNTIFGNLPEEFEFLKIFGYLFVMYFFIGIFKLFCDFIREMF